MTSSSLSLLSPHLVTYLVFLTYVPISLLYGLLNLFRLVTISIFSYNQGLMDISLLTANANQLRQAFEQCEPFRSDMSVVKLHICVEFINNHDLPF